MVSLSLSPSRKWLSLRLTLRLPARAVTCIPYVGGQRNKRKLAVKALAQEHGEGPIPISSMHRRVREPPAQRLHSAVEFIAPVLCPCQRRFDHIGVDATLEQRTADPVGSPLLELALVLGEQPRVTVIAEVSLVEQHLHRRFECGRVNTLLLEMPAHLGCRPLAPVQVPVRQAECALEAFLAL
jgi:hypothetical protein